MIFSIDFPNGMIEPRGLHIPRLEDIQQAIVLAGIALDYARYQEYEEGEEFEIRVTDKVNIFEGKLVDVNDHGEGLSICPSVSPWTLESIFELILCSLFGAKE